MHKARAIRTELYEKDVCKNKTIWRDLHLACLDKNLKVSFNDSAALAINSHSQIDFTDFDCCTPSLHRPWPVDERRAIFFLCELLKYLSVEKSSEMCASTSTPLQSAVALFSSAARSSSRGHSCQPRVVCRTSDAQIDPSPCYNVGVKQEPASFMDIKRKGTSLRNEVVAVAPVFAVVFDMYTLGVLRHFQECCR